MLTKALRSIARINNTKTRIAPSETMKVTERLAKSALIEFRKSKVKTSTRP